MPKRKIYQTGTNQDVPSENETVRQDAQEIAAKINYLLSNYPKPNGERYSFQEVEDATNGEVHNSWLSKLASGQSTRPGLKVITALTRVFGVDPGFWFKDLDQWLKEKQEAEQNGEAFYNRIALRAKSLPPQAQGMLEDIIESYEKRFKPG